VGSGGDLLSWHGVGVWHDVFWSAGAQAAWLIGGRHGRIWRGRRGSGLGKVVFAARHLVMAAGSWARGGGWWCPPRRRKSRVVHLRHHWSRNRDQQWSAVFRRPSLSGGAPLPWLHYGVVDIEQGLPCIKYWARCWLGPAGAVALLVPRRVGVRMSGRWLRVVWLQLTRSLQSTAAIGCPDRYRQHQA
jgi:hypothetical protein